MIELKANILHFFIFHMLVQLTYLLLHFKRCIQKTALLIRYDVFDVFQISLIDYRVPIILNITYRLSACNSVQFHFYQIKCLNKSSCMIWLPISIARSLLRFFSSGFFSCNWCKDDPWVPMPSYFLCISLFSTPHSGKSRLAAQSFWL